MAISDQVVAVTACSFMGYTYDPCMVRLSPALTAAIEVPGVCGVSQCQSLNTTVRKGNLCCLMLPWYCSLLTLTLLPPAVGVHTQAGSPHDSGLAGIPAAIQR